MTDHRRPNDHLVEPLFGGLEGAGEQAQDAGVPPRRALLVALGVAAVVALGVWVIRA